MKFPRCLDEDRTALGRYLEAAGLVSEDVGRGAKQPQHRL